MDEEIILLLILKLLRKARNVPSWRAILIFKSVRKFYFTYSSRNIQENENSGYNQCLYNSIVCFVLKAAWSRSE